MSNPNLPFPGARTFFFFFFLVGSKGVSYKTSQTLSTSRWYKEK
jgi:hypothetical protein